VEFAVTAANDASPLATIVRGRCTTPVLGVQYVSQSAARKSESWDMTVSQIASPLILKSRRRMREVSGAIEKTLTGLAGWDMGTWPVATTVELFGEAVL
jgi:hypothetical protein